MSTKPTSLFGWSSTSIPLFDPLRVASPQTTTTTPFWPKQTSFASTIQPATQQSITPFWSKQTPFVQPSVSTQSDKQSITPLFEPQSTTTPFLFESSIATPSTLWPIVSSTPQSNTKKESEFLFGSISKFDNEKLSTPLLDLSNKDLSKLNLPTNKIEGLIFMVCMDGKNTLSNIKDVIENKTNFKKLPVENLWICCLMSSFIKNLEAEFHAEGVELRPTEGGELRPCQSDELSLFTLLYTSLLKELMIETIQNSEQLYSWLINFAKTHDNKKMLWLFTLLKYAKEEPFNEILNLTNYLEVFALALQTFVLYDNKPVQAVENALQSVLPHFYKTFLLSMIGSSYGKIENTKISELSKTQLSTLVSQL